MRTHRLIRSVALLVALCTSSAWGQGSFTLNAETAPEEVPWEKPATLNWVRSGGKSSGTIDAVLNYKNSNLSRDSEPGSDSEVVKKKGFKVGVYLHKDTDSDSLKNDRGVQVSFKQVFFQGLKSNDPKKDAAGAVWGWDWAAKAQYGKSLQAIKDDDGNFVKDTNGNKTYLDKTKDRETVVIEGYYQPALSGIPRPGAGNPAVVFFDSTAGLYSDHSAGGSKGNGRLSGAILKVTGNYAPWGIDPESIKVGSLGVVPALYATVQGEHDFSQSGERKKENYHLYTIGLTLSFGRLHKEGKGLVPSLSIERSVGADLLTGRSQEAKTEIALGLSF
ncbi:MAG TPA: hypothetical protein VF169_15025 [Albitalea sp.]|uniref:hypothetical protein n=1 Tax=Piscinibacter sp. TaxID=1903157 RepID=UPI002ED2A868